MFFWNKDKVNKPESPTIIEEQALRSVERENRTPLREVVPFQADIPCFPFQNGNYASTQSYISEDSDSVHPLYYADIQALEKVEQVVAELSRMLDAVCPLERIRVDFTNVKPVLDVQSWLPEHYVWMYLNPKTPTGRLPKYIATVEFKAGLEQPNNLSLEDLDHFIEEHPSPEQSYGKIDYLPDGSVGKARLSIWSNSSFYVAYYKLIGGELSVSLLTKVVDGSSKTLFRAE